MPRKKKVIPEYGTCIRKGIEYYRTRIVDSDGKRVSLYARTPEELYEKVQEAERLIAEASFRKENPTVNEYCEKWLLIQKGRLRTTTYTDYEWKVKKYIQKPLGNKYMTDVTPDDVNLAILPALSMSESVYRSTQMLYKLIFTAAADSNIINKSPCSKLSAKGGKPQKVKKALSDEQVEKLLTAIKDLPPYVFVMIGLYCGLRREEILALQWDCVFLDVPAPYLSVKRAWHTEHNRPVILDELKTSAAKRDIPIPPPLADCLKEVKAKSQSPFVVANRDGEPLSYTQFQRVWKYIVTRSNDQILKRDGELDPGVYLAEPTQSGRQRKLGELVQGIKRGVVMPKDALERLLLPPDDSPGICYLTPKHISDGVIEDVVTKLSAIPDGCENFVAKAGDLVISRSGVPFKCAVVDDPNKTYVVDGNLFVCRPIGVDPYFLKGYFEDAEGAKWLKRLSSGLQQTLSVKKLLQLPVPMAESDKAREVASAVRERLERIKRLKRELKRNLMEVSIQFTQTVSGGGISDGN